MKLTLGWSIAVFVTLCSRAMFWPPSGSPSAEATLLVEEIPSVITTQTTCGEWASWVPPRTDPAVVMQVVSKDYVDLEKNFIRLMELNSAFTREHLFLMCLDDASVPIFASLGIRCVSVGTLHLHSHEDLWKARVEVLSCLLKEGYDVIMSDSDALWLGDPLEYIALPAVSKSSILASRGRFPSNLGGEWGSTLCMGFIMFRATGAGMDTFLDSMGRIVSETGDDQIAVNRAALEMGIAWDKGSDMHYKSSKGFGKGTIAELSVDGIEPFDITLLPQNTFTRLCNRFLVPNKTVVAHCAVGKGTSVKIRWMRKFNLWSPDGIGP